MRAGRWPDWDDLFRTDPPAEPSDVGAFVTGLPAGSPAERALRGGLRADRVGYAFIAGYHAACDALMGPGPWPAMCVTEDGPPHPRSVACRFEAGALYGVKNFVTGASHARTLHVLAVAGETEAQRDLVVATVPAEAAGVRIEPLPPAAFVPEVPHGRVILQGAAAVAVAHDGWAARIKPFRTVEDVHVTLAVLAYLARALHRHGGAPEDVDALASLVTALFTLTAAPADAPSTHRALAGVYQVAQPIWARAALGGAEGERWARDRRLLSVAGRARDARRTAAWAKTARLRRTADPKS